LATIGAALAADDQAEKLLGKLEAAKKSFETARERMRKVTFKQLDVAEKNARRDGASAKLKTIANERSLFDDTDELPPSTAKKVVSDKAEAIDRLVKAYESAIREFTKLGDDAKAEEIRKEFQKWRTENMTLPQPGAVLDNGSLDGTNPMKWTFSWPKRKGATEYQLEASRKGASMPVIDVVVQENRYVRDKKGSHIAENLRQGWSWRYRAKIDDKWTAWSPEYPFSVESPSKSGKKSAKSKSP
jgi:cell fate (sporulation/competence/biofilm development) regulator YlbF (YheA/YmcA/DUF963 family)